MNKKLEKLLATSFVAIGYATLVGVGIWRVFRHKPAPHASDNPANAAVPETASVAQALPSSSHPEKLESLSLSTPGDAPLDRLARDAAWERRPGNRPEHSNLETLVPSGHGDPRPTEDNSVADLLEHQSLSTHPLEGWSSPEPRQLPVPTYAPAIMAFGIIVFAMGLVTVWYVCVMGSLIFAIAAWRWTEELQGE